MFEFVAHAVMHIAYHNRDAIMDTAIDAAETAIDDASTVAEETVDIIADNAVDVVRFAANCSGIPI